MVCLVVLGLGDGFIKFVCVHIVCLLVGLDCYLVVYLLVGW